MVAAERGVPSSSPAGTEVAVARRVALAEPVAEGSVGGGGAGVAMASAVVAAAIAAVGRRRWWWEDSDGMQMKNDGPATVGRTADTRGGVGARGRMKAGGTGPTSLRRRSQ